MVPWSFRLLQTNLRGRYEVEIIEVGKRPTRIMMDKAETLAYLDRLMSATERGDVGHEGRVAEAGDVPSA